MGADILRCIPCPCHLKYFEIFFEISLNISENTFVGMAGIDIQLLGSCIGDLLYAIKFRAIVIENTIEIQNCLNFTPKNYMLSSSWQASVYG